MRIEVVLPRYRNRERRGQRKLGAPTLFIDGVIVDPRNRVRLDQTRFEEVVWLNERPVSGDVALYVDGRLVFERVSSDA